MSIVWLSSLDVKLSDCFSFTVSSLVLEYLYFISISSIELTLYVIHIELSQGYSIVNSRGERPARKGWVWTMCYLRPTGGPHHLGGSSSEMSWAAGQLSFRGTGFS